MEEYDKLVETVGKLELDDDAKKAILDNASALNREAGVRGSDLLKVKAQLSSTEEKVASFKEFAEAAKKHGLKAAEIDKLAKQAGVEKGVQDQLDEYKSLVAEKDKSLKEKMDELMNFKKEKEFAPRFEEAINNFKDSEGKAVKLYKSFAEKAKESVLQNIKEGDDDVIINERFNKALIQAQSDQENFMKENEIPVGNNTHRVSEETLTGSGSSSGINSNEIRKVLIDGGQTIEAGVNAVTMARLKTQQNQ